MNDDELRDAVALAMRTGRLPRGDEWRAPDRDRDGTEEDADVLEAIRTLMVGPMDPYRARDEMEAAR